MNKKTNKTQLLLPIKSSCSENWSLGFSVEMNDGNGVYFDSIYVGDKK